MLLHRPVTHRFRKVFLRLVTNSTCSGALTHAKFGKEVRIEWTPGRNAAVPQSYTVVRNLVAPTLLLSNTAHPTRQRIFYTTRSPYRRKQSYGLRRTAGHAPKNRKASSTNASSVGPHITILSVFYRDKLRNWATQHTPRYSRNVGPCVGNVLRHPDWTSK